MSPSPYTCLRCRTIRLSQPLSRRAYHASARRPAAAASDKADAVRASNAPKVVIDVKHIRENVALHKQNCIDRNYGRQSAYPALIKSMFDDWQSYQRQAVGLRQRNNLIIQAIPQLKGVKDGQTKANVPGVGQVSRDELVQEAKALKAELATIQDKEKELTTEIDRMALAMPNLTSDKTPRGREERVIRTFNDPPKEDVPDEERLVNIIPRWRSHTDIGEELDLFDFSSAATTSGWGWYYLLNEAAQLEQALVQYALDAAMARGWRIVSPPSMVYAHMATACGFQPRDSGDEQQIYNIAQDPADAARPAHSLAATAEIPLAAMKAGHTLDLADLPLKTVGVSRCYRAEAGARGRSGHGLYRVHEFTKVEMFAWAAPDAAGAERLFKEMVALQVQLLSALGVRGRVLEMPSTDLGASAMRKVDIEAWFPSRQALHDGWGEVTSTSICGDYQSRRLDTRVRGLSSGKLEFAWTLNGTAMAVPRVLACIIENGWDELERCVVIPEVLRPYMGGKERIGPAKKDGMWPRAA